MSKRNHPSSSDQSTKKPKTVSPEEVTHILDLNDDCLEALFANLDPHDLCAIEETCRRFSLLTDEAFRQKYRLSHFKFRSEFDNSHECSEFQISSRILRLFGKFIGKLRAEYLKGFDAAEHWKNICENCSQLNALSLHGCNLAEIALMDTHFQLNHLDRLVFEMGEANDDHIAQILDICPNITSLNLSYIRKCENASTGDRYDDVQLQGAFLRQKFPRLKDIYFFGVNVNQHFNEFFRRNQQIEEIFAPGQCLTQNRFETIVKHCKNIKSISIGSDLHLETQAGSVAFAGLNHLTELEVFQFNCHKTSITSALEILTGRNALQLLGLTNGTLDRNLCRTLCKFTGLQTLRLVTFDGLNTDLMKNLVSELKLKNLHFILCDNVSFGNIATAIKYSRTLETITFTPLRNIRSETLLDDARFLQLVKARKESSAGFPLVLFGFDEESVSVKVSADVERNEANFIKLKIGQPNGNYLF